MIHSHKELIVWQKSIDLVTQIYQLTARFLKEEIYGLTSQLRRAAVSIPSNIAEGRSRSTRKDYLQFLRISNGSTAEVETQLIIARKLSLLTELDYNKVSANVAEIIRMLRAMIQKLNPHKAFEAPEAGEASNEATL